MNVNWLEGTYTHKNPAYRRHLISRPMRIIAPIFLFPLTSNQRTNSICVVAVVVGATIAATQGAFKQQKDKKNQVKKHKKACHCRRHPRVFLPKKKIHFC